MKQRLTLEIDDETGAISSPDYVVLLGIGPLRVEDGCARLMLERDGVEAVDLEITLRALPGASNRPPPRRPRARR